MISAIVLAAGGAERMGGQKLLLPLKGKPVLRWVLEAALASQADEVCCVVQERQSMQQAISLSHDRLRWVANAEAKQGQSTSIVAGLRAVDPRSEGALFLVGDQPLVATALIDALLSLFKQGSVWIAAPVFRGQTRNPVLFGRNLFPELEKLTGDRGGRALIQRYREKTCLLEWNDEKPFLDLDVREDYEKLQELVNDWGY